MAVNAPKPPELTPAALRLSRLFDGLKDEMLEELAARADARSWSQPGQLLITEGEIAAHMFVVLSGEVEVLHKGGSDHDVRVALLGPGDWVGEMAILDVQPRSASVRALAPSALLRVTAADVRRLLYERDAGQYALLVMNIARELSRRLRVADRVIANASGAVAQRYVIESRRPPPMRRATRTPALSWSCCRRGSSRRPAMRFLRRRFLALSLARKRLLARGPCHVGRVVSRCT